MCNRPALLDPSTAYYDNDAAPTQIILCDATCGEISSDLTAQVDIAVGCQTIVK